MWYEIWLECQSDLKFTNAELIHIFSGHSQLKCWNFNNSDRYLNMSINNYVL